MILLVTGANGYIGQGIVKRLLDQGIEVVAVDSCTDFIDKRAIIYKEDLFQVEKPMEKFTHGSTYVDKVLHLAWSNGFVHNAVSHIEDLPKHYKFLKKLVDSGIRSLAVMGSMHEVGFWEGSIKENTPTNPQSLYGISKNALRMCVESLARENGIGYQWIRGYYIVGNNEYGSSIFSKITKAEKRGDIQFPFTSGENQWDFLDYDEFCNQVAAIVVQDKINGIINACSGKPEKLCERVERFLRDNHYKIKLAYNTFADRPYDSKAVWGDNSKITNILEKYKNDNK